MTIPKFRAWDKVKAKMYNVEVISFINNKVYPVYTDTSHRYVPFNESVLMQSIGMVDENGKEIFEGDIVHAYGEDAYLVGVIEYFDNAYCMKNKNGIYNSFWINAEQYEIIGNIYENPEFLEEE